jgi:hypothetical protein
MAISFSSTKAFGHTCGLEPVYVWSGSACAAGVQEGATLFSPEEIIALFHNRASNLSIANKTGTDSRSVQKLKSICKYFFLCSVRVESHFRNVVWES